MRARVKNVILKFDCIFQYKIYNKKNKNPKLMTYFVFKEC